MVAPVTVREKDLRALLGIVSDDRADLPPEGLPLSLLTDLLGQIRCDAVAFAGFDTARQVIWFGQQVPPDDIEDDDEAFWRNYWDCEACCYPDRSGDLRSVLKISDFYSARQWHSTGMYAEYFRPFEVEHELAMVLPAGPGPTTAPGQTARLLFCWPCCARTCTRPTWTPSGAGAAPRR
jgi:hypothetical protein